MTNKNGIDELLADYANEHGTDAAIQKALHLIFDDSRLFNGELQANVCAGKVTLAAVAAERGKCRLSAKNEQGEALAMDVFNPADAARRDKFTKQIVEAFSLSDAEKKEISAELISLAAAADSIFDSEPKEKTKAGQSEPVETSFQVLTDGRIAEQIKGGLAVFEPATGEYEIVDSVTDADGTIYTPIQDELFTKAGGIQLADSLDEYGSEAELITGIENHLSKYLDLKPLFLKLTALYILFTYMFDAVLELSYLNATGDAGSGKSRFGLAVALAARRGLSLITPSAASLYRIVDKFKPTLFLDEFNSDVNSDDAAAIIQILNAGFQKTAQIPRQVPTADGKYKTEMFDAFCPKIIGSLKQSASNAFNSRCIEIQMERTNRNDIPLRLSRNLLNDAQSIRNKLTLWRMRNINTDFETKLDRAERELRQSGIIPRSIQINIPLYALINDEKLKQDFIKLLKGRDDVLAEEKSLSLDAEIVDNIHTLLFETDEAGTVLNRINFSVLPDEGEICEELRLERLLGMMNADRQKEISSQGFGKMILGLGLKTKKIVKRSSEHRLKKAIVFDAARLGYLFKIHSLPVSQEFNVTNVTKTNNSNINSSLTMVTNGNSGSLQDSICHQDKLSKETGYTNGNIGNKHITEIAPKVKTAYIDEVF
jgi:hypothetical protein